MQFPIPDFTEIAKLANATPKAEGFFGRMFSSGPPQEAVDAAKEHLLWRPQPGSFQKCYFSPREYAGQKWASFKPLETRGAFAIPWDDELDEFLEPPTPDAQGKWQFSATITAESIEITPQWLEYQPSGFIPMPYCPAPKWEKSRKRSKR